MNDTTLSENQTNEAAAGGATSSAGAHSGNAGERLDLDMILNVDVQLSIELGRTEMSIRELLELNQGNVVELDRLAGEALDVRVNGMLIARGEVVVVNERFGLMLTEVVSPEDRIRPLR